MPDKHDGMAPKKLSPPPRSLQLTTKHGLITCILPVCLERTLGYIHAGRRNLHSGRLVALNNYEPGTRCRTGTVHRISLESG